MAERVGFEPTCPCGQDAFEAPPLPPLRYLSALSGPCQSQELSIIPNRGRRLGLWRNPPPPSCRESNTIGRTIMSTTTHADSLQQEIAAVDWYHTIDLGEGVTTPGLVRCLTPSQLEIGRLDGLTVLDIGAWDGAYSFMAERLGAKRVLATDLVVWSEVWKTRNAGFQLARRVLKSNVEDMTIDVMDLSPSRPGVFRSEERRVGK